MQKGFINIIIIGVIAIIIAAVGYFAVTRKTAEAPATNQETEISFSDKTEALSIPLEKQITEEQRQAVKPKPPILFDHAKILQEQNKLVLTPLDMDAIRAEDERSYRDIKPLRIGVTRKLQGVSLGEWSFVGQKNINERSMIVLQQAITSLEANGIRVHFKNFSLSELATLYVYGLKDGGEINSNYSGKGPLRDGDFWSRTIPGDTIILEYHLPVELSNFKDTMPFSIPEIVHNYR